MDERQTMEHLIKRRNLQKRLEQLTKKPNYNNKKIFLKKHYTYENRTYNNKKYNQEQHTAQMVLMQEKEPTWEQHIEWLANIHKLRAYTGRLPGSVRKETSARKNIIQPTVVQKENRE